MTLKTISDPDQASILIADGDIISRHVIADYLRHCGYVVVETANFEEIHVALKEPTLVVDIVLFDVSTLGHQGGFELAQWVRTNRPELEVKLAGGVEMATQTAAELCKNGPHLEKPYEAEAVVSYINFLRAKRQAWHTCDDRRVAWSYPVTG